MKKNILISISFLICVITLTLVSLTSKSVSYKNLVMEQNLEMMKFAAVDYFTHDNLPASMGQVRTMPLREMIDRSLIDELMDEYDQICNLASSFVEVRKINTYEYTLKVNLSCGEVVKILMDTISCEGICRLGIQECL